MSNGCASAIKVYIIIIIVEALYKDTHDMIRKLCTSDYI